MFPCVGCNKNEKFSFASEKAKIYAYTFTCEVSMKGLNVRHIYQLHYMRKTKCV